VVLPSWCAIGGTARTRSRLIVKVQGFGQAKGVAELRFTLGHRGSCLVEKGHDPATHPDGCLAESFLDGSRGRAAQVVPRLEHDEDTDARADGEPYSPAQHDQPFFLRPRAPRMALRTP